MKKETLEEAVQRLTDDWFNSFNALETELVEEGIKWQQERSYSEEDVLNLLWRLYTTPGYMAHFETKADLIEWFEQFKKPKQWYNEAETTERMNIIGQNGNDGTHYDNK